MLVGEARFIDPVAPPSIDNPVGRVALFLIALAVMVMLVAILLPSVVGIESGTEEALLARRFARRALPGALTCVTLGVAVLLLF